MLPSSKGSNPGMPPNHSLHSPFLEFIGVIAISLLCAGVATRDFSGLVPTSLIQRLGFLTPPGSLRPFPGALKSGVHQMPSSKLSPLERQNAGDLTTVVECPRFGGMPPRVFSGIIRPAKGFLPAKATYPLEGCPCKYNCHSSLPIICGRHHLAEDNFILDRGLKVNAD
jgi:hypothetical protein